MNENANNIIQGLTLNKPLVKKPHEMPGLALAYMGDAVWEMYIRQHLLCKGEMQPNSLHKYATRYVKAKSQAGVLHFLAESLSEEEMSVMKRGRNAKSGSTPKNGDLIDYRHATGFESLLGYLYLQGRFERLQELATRSIEWLESQDN
ncbi:Mini-ribonuclease 3 [Tumebacillus permanentifrigoris]|uniref:Mini-ribonuclease 3 n=1 Tax=Tumebacillus permanentifrigoris TaxID=378543 RepID=A0A316DQE8_9BACL|nr:ribonuclease-3 family protein [Tumebacillus permanentifrigoris]